MRKFHNLALFSLVLLIIFLMIICQSNPTFLLFHVVVASLIDWFRFFNRAALASLSYLATCGEALVGKQLSQLAIGSVFGVQLGKNSSLSTNLKTIGMSQLWSASGFSIGIFISIVNSFISICRQISYNKKLILTLLSLFFFWFVSSQSPSVLRAVLSVSLSLVVKKFLGLQFSGLRLLFYVLCMIIIFDHSLTDSISLRFSATAVFGVLQLFPVLSSLLPPPTRFSLTRSSLSSFVIYIFRKSFSLFYKNFALFLSLQLGMLPLISATWGKIGLISLLINTLTVGLAPVIFYLGICWCGWLICLHFTFLFFGFYYLSSTLSASLLFPLITLFEISDRILQLDQFSTTLPVFSPTLTIIWYIVIFLIGRFHLYRTHRTIFSRYSLSALVDSWS